METAKTVVLVVEDEPIILLNAVDIVEQAGMEALPVSNATKALELLETRKDIRLVFTDIDLPGPVDGLSLGRKIVTDWPHVGLVLTSGHMLTHTITVPLGGVFVPKPYLDEQVLDALQGVLEAKRKAT